MLSRRLPRKLKGATLAVLALAAAGSAGAQTPGATATAGAEVAVRFNAYLKEGGDVPALDGADLKVTADGEPRAVKGLRRLDDTPLALVVAIDASASQEFVLAGAKQVADAFVRALIRPGVDEVGLVTFTGDVTPVQELTKDVASVLRAVEGVRFVPPQGYIGHGIVVSGPGGGGHTPAGASAIWDAVVAVCGETLARAPAASRRALLLITDGVDTASRRRLDEAARAAIRAGAVVYAIGVGDDKTFEGVSENDLRKLAGRTGGRAFFPKKAAEIPAVFAEVRAGLRSHYVVTFDAPAARRAGSFRKVEIEITNPELRRRGLKLSHPQGYFND